jgi:hypothetical protein
MLVQRAVSEGWEGSGQTILLARRTRTMKLCSSDARSEGKSGHSPKERHKETENWKTLAQAMARLGVPVGGG